MISLLTVKLNQASQPNVIKKQKSNFLKEKLVWKWFNYTDFCRKMYKKIKLKYVKSKKQDIMSF